MNCLLLRIYPDKKNKENILRENCHKDNESTQTLIQQI